MLDGLLAGITREDIDKMPPVRRQRLAQALRRAGAMLEKAACQALGGPGRPRPSPAVDMAEVEIGRHAHG